MCGIIRRKGFFLNDAEFDELIMFSVDLEKYAMELLGTRSDFNISELLNYSFKKQHERQKEWQQKHTP